MGMGNLDAQRDKYEIDHAEKCRERQPQDQILPYCRVHMASLAAGRGSSPRGVRNMSEEVRPEISRRERYVTG